MSAPMGRTPLNGKQVRLILEVAGCGDYGLVPTPSYLADCEALRERGTFVRSMQTGKATYRLSPAYKAARDTVQAAEHRIQRDAPLN
jgi:hypothetical protein